MNTLAKTLRDLVAGLGLAGVVYRRAGQLRTLPLGAEGEVLTVAGGGLAWVVPAAGGSTLPEGQDNRVVRYDGVDAAQPSPVTIEDDGALFGNRGKVAGRLGAYTPVPADSGLVLVAGDAADVVWTLAADAPPGLSFAVVQGDAGAVEFVPAGGATLHNRLLHTRTAGQWATVTLAVVSNAGGAAAAWLMVGDTAE